MQRNTQSLRRLFFTSLVLLLAASLSPLFASAQQAPVIGIAPTSGPPGTTVIITDLGGNRGRTCFLFGQIPIGTMAGSITYVVPLDTQPGTVMTFVCQGDRLPPSNTVSFTVTSNDSDGDGLPDNADKCPENPGPRENGGCPLPVADSDGDGLPDNEDGCPQNPGPRENGGCPLPPVEPPSPTPPPPPQIVLPQLPASGPCVLATLSAGGVNVRQTPSTQALIVGALNPTQIYSVIGRNADTSWWQINTGWVSTTVTRFGGDCSTVPQTDGAPPTQAPVLTVPEDDPQYGLLLPAIQKVRDAASRMTNCPDLVPQVEGLPTFLALAVIGEADPCAAAQAEIEALFLGGGQIGPYLPNTYELCSNGGTAYFQVNALFDATMNRLFHSDRSAYDTIALLIGADDATLCSVSSVVGSGLVPDIIPDDMVIPLAGAHCMSMDAYADGVAKVRALGMAGGALRNLAVFEQSRLVGGACELFGSLLPVERVNEGNAAFFSTLVTQCGIEIGDAAKRAFSDAIRGALDAGAANALGCDGYAMLESLPLPLDLQPALPQIAAGNAACTGNFRALATYNESLGLDTLFRILKAPNPCDAAAAYAETRSLPLEIVSRPACFEGPRLTLGEGGLVIDIGASWLEKIAALDRALDRICLPLLDLDLDLVSPATKTPTPTPTPLVLVEPPTATPTVTPTATSTLPPDVPTSTPTLTIVLVPTATLPGGGPIGPGGPGTLPGGTGECFGCLPDTLLAPSGRVESVVVGLDSNGQSSLFVLPAGGFDPTTGKANFVHLPVEPDPGLFEGYPATVSPDGTLVGYFTRGGSFTSATRVVRVTLPDGSAGSGLDTEKIALNFVRVSSSTDNSQPLPVEYALQFPIDLQPAAYAPAWSVDGTTLFMSLTDANDVTSVYVLIPEAAGETILPLPIAMNAFAPSVAPNWRYLTYERNDATGRNIYAMAFNSLRENPITQQRPGGECFGPHFGANSLKIFFTCAASNEQRMYIYGLPGVTPVDTNVDNAQNPTPIEADGFIWFDDGLALYLSAEDGSGANSIAGENRNPWDDLESMSIAGPPGGPSGE